MAIELTDAHGNTLTLKSICDDYGAYDAVACSPRTNGFTVVNGLLGNVAPRGQLEAACAEINRYREVCVLPWRRDHTVVLLTPNVELDGDEGCREAKRLMLDLFNASQHQQIQSASLLITQFALRVNRHHLAGVLHGIQAIRDGSFNNLNVICIQVANQRTFEECVRDVFGV